MLKTDIAVDWDWVGDSPTASEKIPAGRITECAGACLKEAKKLVTPKCASVEKKILSVAGGLVKLEGNIDLSVSGISTCLKGATHLSAFIVTIGSGLEETASRLMKEGEELSGYLMDRVGSFAAESLAKNMEERLRKSYASKGLSVTMRFSPGYCGWKIEEQFKLDRLIDFSRAGVRLTENCMLVPRKSVSAAAGIGPKGMFYEKKSQCSVCDRTDCNHRR